MGNEPCRYLPEDAVEAINSFRESLIVRNTFIGIIDVDERCNLRRSKSDLDEPCEEGLDLLDKPSSFAIASTRKIHAIYRKILNRLQCASRFLALGRNSMNGTTIQVRNLPRDWNRCILIKLLAQMGFLGRFDYVYLPMDFKSCEKGAVPHENFGYAFVNSQDHSTALDLKRRLAEKSGSEEEELLIPGGFKAYWGQIQGKERNVNHFKNNALMRNEVPSMCKPALYDSNGDQVSFPAPTKVPKKMRINRSERRCSTQPVPNSDALHNRSERRCSTQPIPWKDNTTDGQQQ